MHKVHSSNFTPPGETSPYSLMYPNQKEYKLKTFSSTMVTVPGVLLFLSLAGERETNYRRQGSGARYRSISRCRLRFLANGWRRSHSKPALPKQQIKKI